MKKYFLYIVLFVFSVFEINAAITFPVQLTCIEVKDDSVIIHWDNPSDPSDFKRFDIYHSSNPSGTDSTLIGTSINVSINSFPHVTNAANNSQQYYFVDIINLSDIAFRSDIIGTIFLQLNTSTDGKAILSWNAPNSLLTGPYKISKYIIRNGITPVWEVVAEDEENTFYNYFVEDGICDKQINFKIEIDDPSGCSSVSNINGDWFSETIKPEPPVFDSVSINIDSHATIRWQASVSPDVFEYILYEVQEDGHLEFDRVTDLFYVDMRYNACNENRKYDIAAVDNCGNLGLKIQNPQRPILLYDIDFNVCAQQDTLRWEPYINVDGENYFIWRKDDRAEYVLIDRLPMPESDTIMTYIDDDIIPGTTYEYFIQAVFENGTSSSCKKTITSYTYKIPQDTYFVNADVTPENGINLALEVDTTVYSCLWEIHRINPLTNDNVIVKTFRRSEIDSRLIEFDDTEVYPQTTSYEYYAKVFDSCSIQRRPSNHLKTIFLEGSKPDEETNHLSWNAFEGWETEVEKYYIYRSSGTETTFVLIGSVDSPPLEYDDPISTEQANEGIFYYWVEAKQIAGIEYNYEEYSASNIVSLVFESSVYFPNAFRPGGSNNEFKPIYRYFNGSNYLFQIFNRWGQMVFETTDTEEGWNGLVNGQHQKSGIYVYRLSYKNIYGLEVDKKGTVLLLQ